jgi:type III pantothenate kinase
VDFGTATTFDVVSEAGEYLGGAISLGLTGASQELHRLAAKLPRVELAFPAEVVGRTTESSIQSGILWGTLFLVEGMLEHIQAELGWKTCHIVATGGLASMIVERSERIRDVEPFLTLEGMRIIYDRLRANG